MTERQITANLAQLPRPAGVAPPAGPVDVAPSFRPTPLARLRGLPILYKVLIANAAIVVLGAVAGTWLTIATVQRAPEGRYFDLALWFVLTGIVLSVCVNFLVLRAAFKPLAILEQTALAVRKGDLSARATPSAFTDPQVAHLAETLNATLDELARDREELRSLASQVIRAQEDERKRISRELHDDTAQVLFAQLLRFTALKDSDSPEVRTLAVSLEEMTVAALESVRRLALELRPPALDDLGLLAALGDLAQRYSDHLGITVDYQTHGPKGRLPAEVELVLYRVAQEALTNIAKHAGAKRVEIDLDRTLDDVTISIRDDGRGFDLDVPMNRDEQGLGLGIFGMEERVALVGGAFRVWSKIDRGCEVFAYIPLVAADKLAVRSHR